MKLHLICNKDGTIVSLHTGNVSGPQAAISKAGIIPGPDQTMHTVEVTEDIRSLSLSEIHSKFTVHVDKEKTTLIQKYRETK